MNYTKKPFDLEYMKANPETKLQTRGGSKVQEWHCFECMTTHYPLFAIINNQIIGYPKDGIDLSFEESPLDLFMLVPVKETVKYFNVYNDATIKASWNTFEEAKDSVSPSCNPTHIVKITTTKGNPPTFEIVLTY